MLVSEDVYAELSNVKTKIIEFEKVFGSPVFGMKVMFSTPDYNGMYKFIADMYTTCVSTMLGRLVVCVVVNCDYTEHMYEFLGEESFKDFLQELSYEYSEQNTKI